MHAWRTHACTTDRQRTRSAVVQYVVHSLVTCEVLAGAFFTVQQKYCKKCTMQHVQRLSWQTWKQQGTSSRCASPTKPMHPFSLRNGPRDRRLARRTSILHLWYFSWNRFPYPLLYSTTLFPFPIDFLFQIKDDPATTEQTVRGQPFPIIITAP